MSNKDSAVRFKYIVAIISIVCIVGIVFSIVYIHQKNKIADCVLGNIGEVYREVPVHKNSKWKTVNEGLNDEDLLKQYHSNTKEQKEICDDLYEIF